MKKIVFIYFCFCPQFLLASDGLDRIIVGGLAGAIIGIFLYLFDKARSSIKTPKDKMLTYKNYIHYNTDRKETVINSEQKIHILKQCILFSGYLNETYNIYNTKIVEGNIVFFYCTNKKKEPQVIVVNIKSWEIGLCEDINSEEFSFVFSNPYF